MKHLLHLLLVSLLAFSTNIYADDQPSTYEDEQFAKDVEKARAVYLEATDGNKRAVRKAIKAIDKLEKKYKNHPLVLAYKGGALSLRGMDIGERPLNRMRETEEGLTILDRTLRLLPDHDGNYIEAVEAKLVAAYVFINLPDSIFHRLKEGSILVDQLLEHPKLSEMPKGLQAAIYFAAATSADKFQDKERQLQYLKLTVKTDPEGINGKEAQAILKDI